MKFFTAGLALVAMLTACISAAALPKYPITDRASNATEPTLDPTVLANLSTWFGWQLAGGAENSNEISAACLNITFIGGDKWKAIGLVPDNIQAPLCNTSGSGPNPQDAFPNSIPAISAIIERQLVGSFSSKSDFAYLCDNLASFQIDQFYLTDVNLLKAVCDRADKQVPPRPFGSEAGRPISKAAGQAAKNTASILYATLLAAGALSDGQLNIWCAHAPYHRVNWDAEQLSATLVESRLCAFKEPLSTDLAQSRILTWTSRLFVTVLENIGKDEEWLGWLCEHLDVGGMNSVGLIGWGSQQQVCDDARNGLPTKTMV